MSDTTKVSVNYFCLGAFLIFVGSVLLCTFGFTVVLPYVVTSSWKEVICTVTNSSYNPNVCSCDDQLNVFDTCVSKYPCLQIRVTYSQTWQKNTTLPTSTVSSSHPLLHMTSSVTDTSPNVDLPTRKLTTLISTSKEPTAVAVSAELKHSNLAGDEQLKNSSSLGTENRGAENLTEIQSSEMTSSYYPIQSSSTTSPLFSSDKLSEFVDVTLPNLDVNTGATGSMNLVNNRVAAAEVPADRTNNRQSLISSSTPNVNADDATDSSHNSAGSLAKLYRSWDDTFHDQCTLTECGDESWNIKESRSFKTKWGRVGQEFVCFYNPRKPEMVITERTTHAAAIHAVVWPGLCLLAGITLWLGLCIGCWSLQSVSAYKDDSGPLCS